MKYFIIVCFGVTLQCIINTFAVFQKLLIFIYKRIALVKINWYGKNPMLSLVVIKDLHSMETRLLITKFRAARIMW